MWTNLTEFVCSIRQMVESSTWAKKGKLNFLKNQAMLLLWNWEANSPVFDTA
jgi:hypothetical protein